VGWPPTIDERARRASVYRQQVDLEHATALRRTVLAVSVLDAVDLLPGDEGVLLEGDHPDVLLAWTEVAGAVGDVDPDSDAARARLRVWVRMRAGLARIPEPQEFVRIVGLPPDHPVHPGPRWVRARVPGEALDLGLGLLGLLDDPDEVVVTPPALLAASEMRVDETWTTQLVELERVGRLAAERVLRDESGPLRPFGDYDVLSLLGSSAYRTVLCGADPVGWRTAAVPMRTRGWLDLGRIDPAFAAAAAMATDPVDRGFTRAVLITPDEVVMTGSVGRSAWHALQDPPARINPWLRGR
jgi:hypothetical protein